MRTKLLLFMLSLSSISWSQVSDSISLPVPPNEIFNIGAIQPFYVKLNQPHSLTDQKINVVHIGDSHIQADLMTNVTRQELQKVYGNGGRGFVFPYALANTNGASDMRFSSNVKWQSLRNIYAKGDFQIGLSGIGLQTNADNFYIEMTVKDPLYFFNTIKLLSPNGLSRLATSTEKVKIVSEIPVPKNITHRIKSGEALSVIADKYNVSVAAIKRLNDMKSNAIRAGKSLKIPSSGTEIRNTETIKYLAMAMQQTPKFDFLKFDVPQSSITLVPTTTALSNLTGIVLENNNNGLIYHNIGVNGAKFSDYNKYTLFFDQISTLEPDLVILSLGTNESFEKLESADYINQLKMFVTNLRNQNPQINIIISTPAPSLFNRKNYNNFIKDYTDDILKIASSLNVAVWNLYSISGGHDGITANASKNLIGPDRVHYTKTGYAWHGKLLADAILNGLYLN